jgi:hypothetical protein
MKYSIIKSFFTFFILSVFVLSFTAESFAKPKFHIVITTKYKGQNCDEPHGWCAKFSVWGDKIMQPLGNGTTFPKDGRSAELQVSDDGRYLYCNFTDNNNPYEGETLDAQGDLTVPDRIAEQLGYQSIVILKGNYRVNFRKNPNGSIKFEILTR